MNRLLDVSLFDDDRIFDEIEFVDFYRYTDVELDEMLAFLDRRAPWIRPADTGRSTNCLINAAGIYVHQLEQGFHNYALPYSWDVRVGHKTRDEALAELDDQLRAEDVEPLLDRDRLRTPPRELLTAWYIVADDAHGSLEVDPDELRDLRRRQGARPCRTGRLRRRDGDAAVGERQARRDGTAGSAAAPPRVVHRVRAARG